MRLVSRSIVAIINSGHFVFYYLIEITNNYCSRFPLTLRNCIMQESETKYFPIVYTIDSVFYL